MYDILLAVRDFLFLPASCREIKDVYYEDGTILIKKSDMIILTMIYDMCINYAVFGGVGCIISGNPDIMVRFFDVLLGFISLIITYACLSIFIPNIFKNR